MEDKLTIQEMANNYAELLPQKRVAKKFCQIDYTAGAKAVLEEIESVMPKTPYANPNEVIDVIAYKIRELKGV